MEEVLNQVKKHLRNGKIAFTVIVLAFAIGEFFLYDFLIKILGSEATCYTAVPIIAVSVCVSLIIRQVTIVQINYEFGDDSLTKFNVNTTVKERYSFIDNYKKTFESAVKLSRFFLCLSIIILIVVAILVIFVLDEEWALPSWGIRLMYAISYDIGTVMCIVIAYTGNFKDKIPTVTFCPECYSFYPFNSEKRFDGIKYSTETKWKDHYGETAGVYVNGEKVGSIQGRTGSTMYERNVTEYKYKIITTCKYCGYHTERSTSEYKCGSWK